MSASSAPPSVSRPSSAAAAVSRSPDITALRASRTRSCRDVARIGAVERLPVGRRGHRVADRVEQVAAQRQRRRPVRRRWRAGGRRRPAPARRGTRRRPPRSRRRAAGTAPRRRSRRTASRWWPMRAGDASQLDQAAGGVAMDPAPPVRRHVVEQRVAHEAVAEPVAGARRLDDQRGERVVEVVERLLLGQPGQRDELVGVERRADDRDALQHLAGRRRDAADHVGVERLHPLRLVGRPPGELVDRERDAPARARRSARPARRAGSATWRRTSAAMSSSPSGPSSSSVAPWRSIRLWRVSASVVGDRRRADGRARCTPAGRASSGRCSAGGAGWRRRRRARRRS